MSDSHDDMEISGCVNETYCHKHKEGNGLWPHECPECQVESVMKRGFGRYAARYIVSVNGRCHQSAIDIIKELEALLCKTQTNENKQSI